MIWTILAVIGLIAVLMWLFSWQSERPGRIEPQKATRTAP